MKVKVGEIIKVAKKSAKKLSQRRNGRLNKKYGETFERDVVERHNKAGIACRRTKICSQSGKQKRFTQEEAFDLVIETKDEEYSGECKASRTMNGYRMVVKSLGTQDFAFFKVLGGEPIVAMSFSTYKKLLLLGK